MSGWISLADGSVVAVRDGMVLGRVAGCDLVVDDAKASRRHARLVVEGGVAEIEDLGSSNGTLLNDKPVTRRVLRDGDRVQIGKTVLVYHEGELPAARAAAAGPVAAAPAAPPPAPAAVPFDDEDDLFGGGAGSGAAATQIARAPEPPSAPVPPPRPVAPPPAPPKPAVVEFADEVVEVRKPAAPAAAAGSAGGASKAVAAAPIASGPRVLQFSKQAQGRGGVLGDDLGQMGGGMRALLVLGALAAGGVVVWLILRAMG